MIAPGTARPDGFDNSAVRAPFGAFEILHGLATMRSLQLRAAARSRRVWIGVIVLGALVCWWIVADHFALSRHMDEYTALLVNRIASHNSVINHAVYIASETTILTGGLLIALVWYCWFGDNAKAVRERLLLGFGAVLVAAVLS